MSSKHTVKLGIIGVGNMGTTHCRLIQSISKIELVAVCDIIKERADSAAHKFECTSYVDSNDLFDANDCEAVLISTPHYQHTNIGIKALESGYHVMVEKPLSVHKADCERLIDAFKDKSKVFAAMFNQRTNRNYRKIKSMIDMGELGEIRRINWIVTDWFRTQSYYDSGGWRATWAGEGGGVLLNQCPHQLDLLQWLFGMPERITAFCRLGQHHDIEVEDEVSAYFEYPNGASGVFITSTGETPGTNRLEITADQGQLIYDMVDGIIHFNRNEISVEQALSSNGPFEKPGVWQCEIPVQGTGRQHSEVLKNFADAILEGKELIAPAAEGIHSVEIGNAMLYSSLTGQTVQLPLDGQLFEKELKRLIDSSTITKRTVGVISDLDDSF